MKRLTSHSTVLLLIIMAMVASCGTYLLAKEAGLMSKKMAAVSVHGKDQDRAIPSKGAVQGAGLQQNDELQACYESFLKSDPKVYEGVVEVHWMLDRRGKISSMELIHSDLEDQNFTHCLLDKIKKMTFHGSPTVQPVLVAHKFNFHRRDPASVNFKQASENDSKNSSEE